MPSVRIVREAKNDYRIRMEPDVGTASLERDDHLEDILERAARFFDPAYFEEVDEIAGFYAGLDVDEDGLDEGAANHVDEMAVIVTELSTLLSTTEVIGAVKDLQEYVGRLEDDLANAYHEGMEQVRREFAEAETLVTALRETSEKTTKKTKSAPAESDLSPNE